ncbi:hypothetical protein WJX72_002237 [[Myrmecia] bisecta]|uniref:RNA helicase n=1 Tax=[Myrmecia] bisecta TaxID=41462 RepID=A0AAW1P6G7_9CHLO
MAQAHSDSSGSLGARDPPPVVDERREHKKRKKEGKERSHKHRSKDVDPAKEGDRSKDRARDKDRDRPSADKERDRTRDKERDRDRDKEKERDRQRREREKAQEKERQAEAERREAERREAERREQERRDRDRQHRPRSAERPRDKREREREERSDHRDKKRRTEDKPRQSKEARDEAQRAEDQAQLDDEIERRRKRIALWQEQRRVAEAAAAKAQADGTDDQQAGKWSFEDDDDEEDEPQPAVAVQQTANGDVAMAEAEDEVDPLDAFMADNATQAAPQVAANAAAAEGEAEVDPLDAFMASQVMPEMQRLHKEDRAIGRQESAATSMPELQVKLEGANGNAAAPASGAPGGKATKPVKRRPRYYDSDSSSGGDDSEVSEEEDDAEWAKNVTAGKLSKADKLGAADHNLIEYQPFRRNFYIEVPDLARMTPEEVAEHRKLLDDIKVRGKDIPKPIKNWNQAGLSTRLLEVLRKSGFEAPMPIQAQALPAIMSGRDCIGIAKTGSGKTLAFVLPMLRHIKDQAPLASGDGPIGLVMAPTRELVQQIGKDIRKFAKPLNLVCVCVYGGSGVANQITELKRGCEVVVCTPGRMIDILVTSGGKITNMRRVTYLVMDEADRMFDMGFEPQITRIVSNIRPDRQTVMFSATFPRSVEVLAKRVLDTPIEIQVGGRSVVNSDITQSVEIRPEADRFLRLLEILGDWYEKGKVLIFVHTQEKCDDLFRDLLKVGYPCLSLHGGKDQSDRESTLNDFKADVCNVLVATSIAARGLDVKELVLVVNYDVPNHHEDYVHRVGRTGRAGNKGSAITFIAPDEDRYAPDLVKALRESQAPVPKDLQALADAFNEKRKAGLVQAHGSGYGGSGFKFDNAEDESRKAGRKEAVKQLNRAEGIEESDEEEDGDVRLAGTGPVAPIANTGNPDFPTPAPVDLPPEAMAQVKAAQELAARLTAEAAAGVSRPAPAMTPTQNAAINPLVAAAQAVASQLAVKAGMPGLATSAASAAQRASQLASQWTPGGVMLPPEEKAPSFEAELEINDFPQHARWKVTHKDAMASINELTGAAVTTKGYYYKPGTAIPEGERKLYLLIEGPTESSVRKAKAEIKRILEETTEKVMRRDGPAAPGRYSIV